MEDPAFGFEPIHILFAAIGGSLLLAYWLPRLIFPRPPSTSAILILFGMLGSFLFPDAFSEPRPHGEAGDLGAHRGDRRHRGAFRHRPEDRRSRGLAPVATDDGAFWR